MFVLVMLGKIKLKRVLKELYLVRKGPCKLRAPRKDYTKTFFSIESKGGGRAKK